MQQTIIKSPKNVKNVFCYLTLIKSAVVVFLCLLATPSFAQLLGGALRSDGEMLDNMQEIKETKGKGWQLNSGGGISYINPQDERYWFSLSGVLRVDQILYNGSYKARQDQPFIRFINSGNIRRADFTVEGGIGEDWEYSASFFHRGFIPGNQQNRIFASTVLEDTFVGYMGFCKNAELFIGRLSGNWFGLEGSTGTTWAPFLEKSAQMIAFYPGDGIGFMGDMWWDDGEITVLATQADHRSKIFANFNNLPVRDYGNDRWRFLARATYAPVHCLGDVWHFGISAAHRRNDPTLDGLILNDFALSSVPGAAVPRNVRLISFLLSTGGLSASYAAQWNVEAARQIGPFIAEAEYTNMFVHRTGNPQGSLTFNGWNVQARYMLTGEAHVYDVRDGNFGKVDIKCPYGAWEVAARYDYLNLNDKDINGGSQHNFTAGINWFINSNVRTSFNYVRMRLHPSSMGIQSSVPIRKLDVFGVRLQVKFK